MIACVQRVSEASVKVSGKKVGSIGSGLLILFCVEKGDTEKDAEWMAEKIVHLRIFENETGNMERSLKETGGSVLIISQFTLAASCRKGRRPDFTSAEKPDEAKKLYEKFIDFMDGLTRSKTASGVFGAHMEVSLVNDGPVTLIVEKREGPGGRISVKE